MNGSAAKLSFLLFFRWELCLRAAATLSPEGGGRVEHGDLSAVGSCGSLALPPRVDRSGFGEVGLQFGPMPAAAEHGSDDSIFGGEQRLGGVEVWLVQAHHAEVGSPTRSTRRTGGWRGDNILGG